MLTCFYMSNILMLCSVLLELMEGVKLTGHTGQMRSWGCQGLWMGGEQINCIPGHQWDEFIFFPLENCGKPGEMSYDFFFFCFLFQNRFFFKKTILYDPLRKPGSCWVEYILSIRGLFLPTVSWNLADGKHITVDDYHAGRGVWRLSPGFLFEHVPFLNYASTGKTQ